MSLSNAQGKKLNIYVNAYCIFDLETTGTSTVYDEVVEISAVKVLGGQVVDEYTTLVNPGRPIPFQASQVNGITDEMVADAPAFDVALMEFIEFVGDLVLVGHNIHTFDMKFLYRDSQKYLGKTISNDYVDTLILAREYLPELDHHRLVDLAKHYGISSEGAHRALNDCRMNQKVYEYLAKEIENPSEAVKAVQKCPKCGGLLKKRSGRFGEFLGCSEYPVCRYTMNL